MEVYVLKTTLASNGLDMLVFWATRGMCSVKRNAVELPTPHGGPHARYLRTWPQH